MLHTINTSLWGSTGLFVGGVSVPDPGSFQQGVLAKIQPGQRLPNIPNPVIVMRDGEPVLAACTIGNAVHACMIQHLVNVIDHGMSPEDSLAKKKFWAPWWGATPADYQVQAVDADAVKDSVREQLASLGQPLRVLREEERAFRIAYWLGLKFSAEFVEGAVSPKFNGRVEPVDRGTPEPD
jgi:gamma-glutamyltranspeptidase/glutathione hydrolase